MNIEKEETDLKRMLQVIDPFNNQQISFSQCVTLFSSVKLNKNLDLIKFI